MTGISTAVLTDVAHRNSPRRYNARVGVMETEAELGVVDPLAAGREALSRGAWKRPWRASRPLRNGTLAPR